MCALNENARKNLTRLSIQHPLSRVIRNENLLDALFETTLFDFIADEIFGFITRGFSIPKISKFIEVARK